MDEVNWEEEVKAINNQIESMYVTFKLLLPEHKDIIRAIFDSYFFDKDKR